MTLVSACLLGVACRYDGQSKAMPRDLAPQGNPGQAHLIPICPEVMAGMGIPRPPIERLPDGRVRRVNDGADVTAALEQVAARLVALAKARGATRAVLKEYSPSCGVHALKRDGVVVPGRGLVAERLGQAGLELVPAGALQAPPATEEP